MLLGVNTLFVNIEEPRLGAGPADVYARNAPQSFGYKVPSLGVYLETSAPSITAGPATGGGEFERADRIDVTDISYGRDGGDTSATLITHLDANDLGAGGEIGERHFAHLIHRLGGDRRVRIMQTRGAGVPIILFQGYPQPQTVRWSGRGESFEVVCLDEGQERLAHGFFQQILGRRMRFDPLAGWEASRPDDTIIETLAAVFNAGGKPNRSAKAYPFAAGAAAGESHSIPLFVTDGAPEAKHWRYVDALRYVAYFYALRARDSAPIGVAEFLADTAELAAGGESPDDGDPFVRLITATVKDASVQSVSARDAITLLCDEGRLHYEIALRTTGSARQPNAEHFLRIFATLDNEDEVDATPERRMGSPRVHDAPREAPFTDMDGRTAADVAGAGAAAQAAFTIDRRVINAPLYLGAPKTYEVTLLLRPMWLPHGQLDDLDTDPKKETAEDFWFREFVGNNNWETRLPNSVYHAKNPQHHTVKDVGRLWGFPDDFRYVNPRDPTQSDYARLNWPAHLYSPYSPWDANALMYAHATLGAGIADARDWVPRRRPFGETIARRKGTGDRRPIVWINYDVTFPETALSQAGWVPLSGGYNVDETRAVVDLGHDNLLTDTYLQMGPEQRFGDPADSMLYRYIDGRLMLAITCTIEGDKRMYHDPMPSSTMRRRYQVHDHGAETFASRDRSHNVWADRLIADEPEYDARDDTERMERFDTRDADLKARPTVSGSIEIPWITDAYRIGDSISGAAGLGIEFDSYPEIVRVQHVKVGGGGQRTILHLTDLRHAPEAEAEVA